MACDSAGSGGLNLERLSGFVSRTEEVVDFEISCQEGLLTFRMKDGRKIRFSIGVDKKGVVLPRN